MGLTRFSGRVFFLVPLAFMSFLMYNYADIYAEHYNPLVEKLLVLKNQYNLNQLD